MQKFTLNIPPKLIEIFSLQRPNLNLFFLYKKDLHTSLLQKLIHGDHQSSSSTIHPQRSTIFSPPCKPTSNWYHLRIPSHYTSRTMEDEWLTNKWLYYGCYTSIIINSKFRWDLGHLPVIWPGSTKWICVKCMARGQEEELAVSTCTSCGKLAVSIRMCEFTRSNRQPRIVHVSNMPGSRSKC